MAEEKKAAAKVEEKVEKKDTEKKVETKTEEKKIVKPKKVEKKELAIANGFGLKVSPKQCIYVCKIIKGKSPEAAIARLQAVVDEKRPVPMAALEVGHKKGRGLAGGKFPKNACKAVMEVVKQAGANAVVNGIETPVISIARSDRAAAPFRRAGRKAKRCHIHIEVVEKSKYLENKSKKGAKKK
jgi:large subunit ribosomal protein L22